MYSADDYDLVRQKLDQEHEHVFMRLKGREEVAIMKRNANNRFYYCAPWDPDKPRLRDATSGRLHSVNGVLEAAYQSLRLVAKQGLAEGDKSRWVA